MNDPPHAPSPSPSHHNMFKRFKGTKPTAPAEPAVLSLPPAAPYYDLDPPTAESTTTVEASAHVAEADVPAVKPALETRDSQLTVGTEAYRTPTAEIPEPPLSETETKETGASPTEHAETVVTAPAPLPPVDDAVASPSHIAIAEAAMPSGIPASPGAKARRRSLPGFGFFGNKKHAESVARDAVLSPTSPPQLVTVVEAPPEGADLLAVPTPEPRRRKKSLKKPRPKADPAKPQEPDSTAEPTVEPSSPTADAPMVIATVVPELPAEPLKEQDVEADVAPTSHPEPKQKKERHVMVKKSERKAEAAAIDVRTLIIGPDPESSKAKPLSKSEVNKLKGMLLEPKSAGKVIQRLRNLPVPQAQRPSVITRDALQHSAAPEADVARAALASAPAPVKQGPIHAVCLDCTDREADEIHFSQLTPTPYFAPSFAVTDPAAAFPVLRNMHIISLLRAPDFGLGHPIGSPEAGILSGSVPTPAVIANGILQLSQQLVALGYASGATISADHTGVYPPLDRMSVLTYWWGLEVCLPKASIQFLANAKSVQNTVLNVLTALSTFNTGVREILPFIRYISQFVDFEWSAIQGQDKGQGVVCAATWVMPAALVPRPWDFAAPPDDGSAGAPDAGQTRFDFVPSPPPTFFPPEVKVIPATLPRHVTLKDMPDDEATISASADTPATFNPPDATLASKVAYPAAPVAAST
ncbi:hypothetical protein BKA62DRAFT_7648 [Auriculariales sp. MPI-PUGE-AT-0066]|nr:hypothetical protein BKA62DRAFT_7648 [Auriculariales sp. MPI-PUGE-AT-0066]